MDENVQSLLYPDVQSRYTCDSRQKVEQKKKRGYNRTCLQCQYKSRRDILPTLIITWGRQTNFFWAFEAAYIFCIIYFFASCIARGFVGNDQMWVACLEEASTSQSEHSLKKLFAQLVAQCNVANQSQLWAQFVGSLRKTWLGMPKLKAQIA